MSKYNIKEESTAETTTVSNSKFVKLLAEEFLNTINVKNSWGKNQIMTIFTAIMPNNLMPGTLPNYIIQEFARKIEMNNSWGKNQIELIFVKAVANAALIMLDKP